MENYICHYGVKGQRWGVRRYQNENGTLTAEGKRRLRNEITSENRQAYKLGKTATTYGRALAYSTQRLARAQKKADKANASDSYQARNRTRRLNRKLDIEKETNAKIDSAYKRSASEAEAHAKQLVKKYGKENVKDIAYKDVKTTKGKTVRVMNEKVSKGGAYALSALSVVGAAAIGGMGGAALFYVPAGKGYRGEGQYRSTRRRVAASQAKKEYVHYVRL